MTERPGAMQKHGEKRQIEVLHCQAELKLVKEPELLVFKSAGQIFLVAQ